MNNSDLVWRLVELLLQKENDLKQVALDQAQKDSEPDVHKQDEAQLAEIMIMQHYHFAALSFLKMKKN